MNELNEGQTLGTDPERLDGRSYWDELADILTGYAEIEAKKAELNRRAAALARHLTEPASLSALVHIPEGAVVHLSRNYGDFPTAPTEFTAEGVEALDSDKLVLFNRSESLWLWTNDPAAGFQIEPIDSRPSE